MVGLSAVLLRCFVCFLVFGSSSLALAADATLAVLPLKKGSGSEEYEGLGQALAGMLVTDLSTVDGVTLVERERLSDLLAEIKLNKSGFLDAKTAQKLGKGVGAQFIVTGSYSVVAKKFLLDARVVKVESGKVMKAANAHGTVEDFVAVEKDLVESLLDGLSVKLTSSARRKIIVQAPTEKFDAFKEYGKGLARQDQGDVEEAKAAFTQALTLDPQFEQARSALTSLRGFLDAVKSQDKQEKLQVKNRSHRAVLKAYPSELSRGDGFEYDVESTAGFALRLMVYENEGQHCKRYKAMLSYLDRVKWRVRPPSRGPGGSSLMMVIDREAERHGFDRLAREVAKNKFAEQSPRRRLKIFESTYDFIVHDAAGHGGKESSGVIGALTGCYEPKEQMILLDELRAKVVKNGRQMEYRPKGRAPFNLEQALKAQWLWVHAGEQGATKELERRSQELLQESEDDPDLKRDLLRFVESLVRRAEQVQTRKERRAGKSEQALIRFARGVVKEDRRVVRLKSDECKALHGIQQSTIESLVDRTADFTGDPRALASNIDTLGVPYAAYKAYGCLTGQRGRFKKAKGMFGFLNKAKKYALPGRKKHPTCSAYFSTAKQMTSGASANSFRDYPQVRAQVGAGLALVYAGLVASGCISQRH